MKKLIQTSLINPGIETELIGRARNAGSAVFNRELSYCPFAKLLVG
jgi:hypothetical protein